MSMTTNLLCSDGMHSGCIGRITSDPALMDFEHHWLIQLGGWAIFGPLLWSIKCLHCGKKEWEYGRL